MDASQKKISAQYADGDLLDKIKQGLSKVDKSFETIFPEDVTGVDEFHIRGRESTAELADLLDIGPDSKVLDVGCGLGGACRYLALQFNASVTGIDITKEYCQVAEAISRATGSGEEVNFHQSDACALPFEDGQFDSVITMHTQMNIEDKDTFYSEIRRVLKPGGQFGFYDIFSGSGDELMYPVPWADDPSISWLADSDSVRDLLASMDFDLLKWHDDTATALRWFKQKLKKVKESGPPPIGLHLLMGADAPDKMKNMIKNLEDNNLEIVRAAFQK